MALKEIKAKIAATRRTHKVTRAMEAVSAVKMRKTQITAIAGRPYARAALQILARLSGSGQLTKHPLAAERPVRNTALVIITSDRGLAGALNANVLRAARAECEGKPVEHVYTYAYGRKGADFFARRGYPSVRTFLNTQDVIDDTVVTELAEELSDKFLAEEYDEVLVAYSCFRSTFEQVPTVRRILPLSVPVLQQLVEDIAPERGKFSDLHTLDPVPAYTVEPSETEVFDVLVPRLVGISLYHMLMEAKASEHSARMVAMKNASEKSEEVANDLTRSFNKARQAAITREVSEIVGGREALATNTGV